MSDTNRCVNVNGDITDLLNVVIEDESTTTGQMNMSDCMSTPLQQPTPVGQMATDERPNHLDQITRQQIDETTARELSPRRLSTSVNGHDIPRSVTQPWTEESPFDYVFAANRDQQPNNRICHPSDTIEQTLINLLIPSLRRLLENVMRNIIPLSIENTQPHTMPMPAYLNTFLHDVVPQTENGDINEDGTVTNNTDDIMNDENFRFVADHSQMIIRESQGLQVTDELTYNGNPVVSTDVQDDSPRDASNEETPDIDFERNMNTQHEDVSNNDQVASHTSDDDIQDNIPSTASIPTLPVVTPRIESSGQATDVEPMLAGPTDNNQTMEHPALLLAAGSDATLTNAHTPKQAAPFNSSEERTVE